MFVTTLLHDHETRAGASLVLVLGVKPVCFIAFWRDLEHQNQTGMRLHLRHVNGSWLNVEREEEMVKY